MPSEPLPPAQILTMLAATPSRLSSATAGLPPAALQTAPGPDEWSAVEVLAHMRACADVWGAAIATMLAEDAPALRAVNPRTWIKRTDYRTLAFAPSLAAFSTQRADLLAVLQALPPAGWDRTATVTGAGAVLTRTVRFYAQWLARHERAHVNEIERIAAALRG